MSLVWGAYLTFSGWSWGRGRGRKYRSWQRLTMPFPLLYSCWRSCSLTFCNGCCRDSTVIYEYGLATVVYAVSLLPFWKTSCERETNLWKVKDPTSISQELFSPSPSLLSHAYWHTITELVGEIRFYFHYYFPFFYKVLRMVTTKATTSDHHMFWPHVDVNLCNTHKA